MIVQEMECVILIQVSVDAINNLFLLMTVELTAKIITFVIRMEYV